MARSFAGLLAGVALGAEGARISRKGSPASVDAAKTLAGVPVLNYHTAYGGRPGPSMEHGQREHWVVVAKKGVTDKTLEYLCESSGSCERMGHPGEGGVPFFEVYATEHELEKVLSMAPNELEFVEPDGTVYLIPEQDVDLSVATSASWGLDRVGAPSRDKTGRGVHIYVLDTGVRVTHDDFGGRAFPGIDLTGGGDLVECRLDDTSCSGDSQGHGTHCAGTAGGTEYGVAVDALIYGGKVLSDSGSGSWSWSYAALDWLATTAERPAISSMSLGGSGTQEAMRVAVDAAVDAGVVVVVAGGNSNSDSCFFSPAFIPSSVTVGSTTSTDQRSSFSNYGSCTDIWAPGSSITSAAHTSNTGSATFDGTSMACPHVSGAAALVLQESPNFSPASVLEQMLSTAEQGALSDLRPGDTNALLWVGAGPAPVPAPTEAPPPAPQCPDFAANRQPDRDNECLCQNRQWCSTDGRQRNCPTAAGPGGHGGRYFLVTCTDCRCFATLR